MRNLRQATWIFFDSGNVLMDTYATDMEWAKVASGVLTAAGLRYSPEVLLQAQQSSAADGSLNTKRDALGMLGITHLEFARVIQRQGWPSLDEPYPDAMDAIAALKGYGYRLGLIADQSRAQDTARLEWCKMLEQFEVTILPEESGLAKPDPEIFELALEMAGCRPRDAIMVGDHVSIDITPAKLVGMQTVWMRRGIFESQFDMSRESNPDLVVPSLEALAKQLERPVK